MDSTSSSKPPSPSFHPDMLLPGSRSQSQSRCSTPSKGILKARLLKRNGSSSSCCSRVHFADKADEHFADDYDRCPCPIATPTFREIRELERIRRELVPSGRGITDQDFTPETDPGEFTFSFDDGDDCDQTQRLRPPPKQRLRGVPIELCPLLPADCPTTGSASPSPGTTPYNSNASSPLNSPPHGSPALTPMDCSVPPNPHGRFAYRGRNQQPRGGALMSFLPILPAAAPITSTTPIPTPPETPTLLKLDLCADDAPPRSAGQADLAQPTMSATTSLTNAIGGGIQEKTLLLSTRPTYSYDLPLSTSPKNPPRCRMTILPCNSERQFAAVPPSSTLLSSSPPKSTLGVNPRACSTATQTFTPVNAPTTTSTQSFTPFQMSFKATARTY